jgi:small-conductance mechanosensitive channel
MSKLTAIVVALVLCLIGARDSAAQVSPKGLSYEETIVDTAPVKLDGGTLFLVRGVASLSARDRARAIGTRIRRVAANREISADSIAVVESDGVVRIMAERELVMTITNADVALESLTKKELETFYISRIRSAVEGYRSDRTRGRITRALFHSVLWTLGLVGGLIVFIKLYRRLWTFLETRFKGRIRPLRIRSLDIVSGQRFWGALNLIVRVVQIFVIVAIVYTYIELVLGSLPWTRFIAVGILGWIRTPLQVAGVTIAEQIPNLLFIAIVVFITRLVLKLIRLFFARIEDKSITFSGFDPEWSMPTYNLVRLAVIAFAVIVCYPYLPGANSDAFKGISIFMGVILSLGSTSAVSNFIAGYVMIYRRAFKTGDLVKINDVMGIVTERRLQVTHLRTVKNEEIIIPNSIVVNSSVMNYNTVARESGLILHTEVTIGYDTPWRQVHALLLMGAERTEGILKEPKPFVLQRSLDDFFIRYELNAYTDAPTNMLRTYSELHRNILDAFNEHGVQIMSPHYLGDPAGAKVVPKDEWYAPPADRPMDKASPSS